LQELAGDDLVPGPVGVLVGPARRAGALPGPLAQPGHVARDAGSRWPGEVGRVEGAEHVRDRDSRRGVDPAQHVVVDGGQLLLFPPEDRVGASDLGWVDVFPSDAPIVAGTNVAVIARIFGVWFLNCCRIVYTVDDDGPVRSVGFAYGTLPEHAESGEERFTVEWHRRDDSVWYDLLAFSRPNQFLARIGYPVARTVQKRFATDSKKAMLRYTLRSLAANS